MAYSVNIEVGHIASKTDCYGTSIEYVGDSIRLGRQLHKRFSDQGLRSSISILVDDKDEDLAPAAWMGISRRLADSDLVGFVVSEANLQELVEPFLDLFPTEDGRLLRKKIDERRAIGKPPACSRSIALWHLYRLGVLGNSTSLIESAASPESEYSTFFSTHVVSILPEKVRPYEERASDEYLKPLDFDRRIYRCYLIPGEPIQDLVEGLVRQMSSDGVVIPSVSA